MLQIVNGAGPYELETGTTWPASYAAGRLDRILQRHAEAARMRNNSNAEASFNTFNTSEKCNLRRHAGECKYALTESPPLASSLARAEAHCMVSYNLRRPPRGLPAAVLSAHSPLFHRYLMKLTAQFSLRIAEPTTTGPMSRARKQFNTLIKKLEAMRLRLAAWKEAMPAIMRQAEQEFQPLAQAYSVHQRALVLLLDQMFQHKSMGKKDRAKLADLICSMALELLADDDDAELKDIYNRHSGGDFDAEADQDDAEFKGMMENILGVQMDADVDLRSPEAMLEALTAQLGRRVDQEQQAAQAKAAARRKPAGALAREQRQAAEADKLKQTVRDIFRKLVSELHPDREPDAAERERKTALMQRVNVAYAANDLLGLLELQLEIEQIDQAGLNNLSEERIKQYNKILDGQLREIERETASIEYLAAMEMGGQGHGHLTPQALLRCLRVDIAEMQAKVVAIVAELEEFRDVNKLKAWLKTYRPAEVSDYDDADLF
jgi:hypothetical protein